MQSLTEIDNPGAGHCGFYALAIALLEKICIKKQKQILQRWLELDPNAQESLNIIQQEVNKLTEPLTIHLFESNICKKSLLEPLKNSIKKILLNHVLEEIAIYQERDINYLDARKYFISKFTELLENSTLGLNLQVNPFYNKHELKAICNTIHKFISPIENCYIQDYLKYILINFVVKNDKYKELFIQQLKYQYRADTPWYATDEELKLLAELFNCELNIFKNSRLYKERVGCDPIFLNNHTNIHWTTFVYPVGFDMQSLSQVKLEETNVTDSVADFESSLQVFKRNRIKDEELFEPIRVGDLNILDFYQGLLEQNLENEIQLKTAVAPESELKKRQLRIKIDFINSFKMFYTARQHLLTKKDSCDVELNQIIHKVFEEQQQKYTEALSQFLRPELQIEELAKICDLNTLPCPDALKEYFSIKFDTEFEHQKQKSSFTSFFGLFTRSAPVASPKAAPAAPIQAQVTPTSTALSQSAPHIAGTLPIQVLTKSKPLLLPQANNFKPNHQLKFQLGGIAAGAIFAEIVIHSLPQFIVFLTGLLATSTIGAHLLFIFSMMAVGLIIGKIIQDFCTSTSLAPVSP
jgi:hypothetical protein